MDSEFTCDLCEESLIPNNIGKLEKKESEKGYTKICKDCKKLGR